MTTRNVHASLFVARPVVAIRLMPQTNRRVRVQLYIPYQVNIHCMCIVHAKTPTLSEKRGVYNDNLRDEDLIPQRRALEEIVRDLQICCLG